MAAAVIGGVFLVVTTVISERADQAPPEAADPAAVATPAEPRCPAPRAAEGPAPAMAVFTVVHTEGRGIRGRCGPAATYPVGEPGTLAEGTRVAVACQVPDGQLVRDPQNADFPSGHPRESRAWDLLLDGRWAPDLYLSTPKSDDGAPPPGIPRCGDAAARR